MFSDIKRRYCNPFFSAVVVYDGRKLLCGCYVTVQRLERYAQNIVYKSFFQVCEFCNKVKVIVKACHRKKNYFLFHFEWQEMKAKYVVHYGGEFILAYGGILMDTAKTAIHGKLRVHAPGALALASNKFREKVEFVEAVKRGGDIAYHHVSSADRTCRIKAGGKSLVDRNRELLLLSSPNSDAFKVK